MTEITHVCCHSNALRLREAAEPDDPYTGIVVLWYDAIADQWEYKKSDGIIRTFGGNSLLNGTVDPTTEGADGDFYLNTATFTIFGPKAAGVWPTGVNLGVEAGGTTGQVLAKASNADFDTAWVSLGTAAYLDVDTDTTLAADSDSKIATQKAVKAFVESSVTGLWDLKTGIDCSADPNYPTALKGDAYVVTVAGKIGGASGISVEVGDVFVAFADNAGGTQAAVGSSWFVMEHNLVGALLAANNLSDLPNKATARDNLGVEIGADVQAYNINLDALSGLTGAADNVPYFTGAGTMALTGLTSAGRNLIDDTTVADQRTTLGLVIGTDVQAYDIELTALAGLTSAADRLPYFTGSGTASLATFTAAARNLLDDATVSDMRTTLGLGSFATISSLAHSALTGLSADDHAQYALLAGRSGGQTLIGDTTSGGNLTLQSTAHATLGTVAVNSLPSTVSTINHMAFGVTNAVTANSLNYAGTVIQLESAHTATSSGTHRGLHVQAGIASGNAFNASGLRSYSAQIAHLGSGTISSAVGMEILSPINTGGGTITTSYGLYVAAQAAGGTGYGIYQASAFDANFFAGATTFSGNVLAPFILGGTSSGANLFLSSTTHATKGEIRLGAVSSYDEVNSRMGIGTRTPAAKVHSIATTEQSRLGYDTSSYFSTTVSNVGDTTFSLNGVSPAFIFNNPIGIGRDPGTYIFDVYNASATSFMNIETGTAGANGSIRLGNPGRKWIMGVRGDISDSFAFADQTASAIRFVIDASGNVIFGGTAPSARLHAISTTEQLRIGYNTTNYYSTTVNSTGGVTFDAVSSGSGARFSFADVINLTTQTPASAAATGTTGDFVWDSGFLYVCTGTNTWKRVAIASW